MRARPIGMIDALRGRYEKFRCVNARRGVNIAHQPMASSKDSKSRQHNVSMQAAINALSTPLHKYVHRRRCCNSGVSSFWTGRGPMCTTTVHSRQVPSGLAQLEGGTMMQGLPSPADGKHRGPRSIHIR